MEGGPRAWSTNSRDSFQPPRVRERPTYRTRLPSKDAEFDHDMIIPRRGKSKETASGFVTSMTLCDGKTWVPERNLNSDMIRTEYRNRFNQKKPFHKAQMRLSMYALPK